MELTSELLWAHFQDSSQSEKVHLQDDGLAERRLVVNPGAPVAVAASADLEIEGTVDFVLFSAEN